MPRLFFALWPDEDTRHALAQVMHQLPQRSSRYVAEKNLHLTLVFLGNISVDSMDRVVERAKGVRTRSARLSLDTLGWWKKPQVVWLAPGQIPPELSALAAELSACANAASVRIDEHPYQPHVTLVRKVRHKPELPVIKPVNWPIRGYTLVESITRPEGVVYEVLRYFP